jgi:hypothetical protein
VTKRSRGTLGSRYFRACRNSRWQGCCATKRASIVVDCSLPLPLRIDCNIMCFTEEAVPHLMNGLYHLMVPDTQSVLPPISLNSIGSCFPASLLFSNPTCLTNSILQQIKYSQKEVTATKRTRCYQLILILRMHNRGYTSKRCTHCRMLSSTGE